MSTERGWDPSVLVDVDNQSCLRVKVGVDKERSQGSSYVRHVDQLSPGSVSKITYI